MWTSYYLFQKYGTFFFIWLETNTLSDLNLQIFKGKKHLPFNTLIIPNIFLIIQSIFNSERKLNNTMRKEI